MKTVKNDEKVAAQLTDIWIVTEYRVRELKVPSEVYAGGGGGRMAAPCQHQMWFRSSDAR